VLAVVTVAIAWAVRTPKVDPAGAHGAPATEPGEALEPALD
jgi:hypothetical protein